LLACLSKEAVEPCIGVASAGQLGGCFCEPLLEAVDLAGSSFYLPTRDAKLVFQELHLPPELLDLSVIPFEIAGRDRNHLPRGKRLLPRVM
jgi:hypothetical protein